MEPIKLDPQNPVVAIFERSRIYGAIYLESKATFFVEWPTDTWFQDRLKEVRERDSSMRSVS